METPITNKVQQILENGGEYEQSRSTGIIIKSAINFIDAAYEGLDGRKTTDGNSENRSEVENTITREQTPKSEINEQQ